MYGKLHVSMHVSMYAIISYGYCICFFIFTKLMRAAVDNCKLYASFHGLAVIADIDFESDFITFMSS